MARQDAGGGVAAGDQQARIGFLFVQQLNGGTGAIHKQPIGGQKLPGRGGGRHAHQAAIHAAKLDGAAGKQVTRGHQVGLECGRRSGLVGIEMKQLFHTDFEDARQAQRDGGIGNVAAGLHGVHRLPADACAAGQIGGRHTALLADLGQPAVDLRLTGRIRRGCIMVTCG